MVLGKKRRKQGRVLALTLAVTVVLGMLPAASARAERIEAENPPVTDAASEKQEAETLVTPERETETPVTAMQEAERTQTAEI